MSQEVSPLREIVVTTEKANRAFDEIAGSDLAQFIPRERAEVDRTNGVLWLVMQKTYEFSISDRGIDAGDAILRGLLVGHGILRGCVDGDLPQRDLMDIKAVTGRQMHGELETVDTPKGEETRLILPEHDMNFYQSPVLQGVLERFNNPTVRSATKMIFMIFEDHIVDPTTVGSTNPGA